MTSANINRSSNRIKIDTQLIRNLAKSQASNRQAATTVRGYVRAARNNLNRFKRNASRYDVQAVYTEYNKVVELIQQANELLYDLKGIDPTDPLVTELHHFLDVLDQEAKVYQQTIKLRIVDYNDLKGPTAEFIKAARRNGALAMSNSKSRESTPTGGNVVEKLARVATRHSSSNRTNASLVNNSIRSQAAQMTGMMRGPSSANASYDRRSSAIDRQYLNLTRQVIRRDGEFQEWQKDFWTAFRKDMNENAKKYGGNGGNGLGISDILGALIGKSILDKMAAGLKKLFNLKNIFRNVKIGTFLSSLGFDKQTFKYIEDAFSNLGNKIRNGFASLKNAAGNGWLDIKETFNSGARSITNSINASKSRIFQALSQMTDSLSTWKANFIKSFGGFAEKLGIPLNKSLSVIDEWKSASLNSFRSWQTSAFNTLDNVATGVANRATQVGNAFRAVGVAAMNGMKPFLDSLDSSYTRIISYMNNIKAAGAKLGSHAANTAVSGAAKLGQGANWLGGKIANAGGWIADNAAALKNSFKSSLAAKASSSALRYGGAIARGAGRAAPFVGGVVGGLTSGSTNNRIDGTTTLGNRAASAGINMVPSVGLAEIGVGGLMAATNSSMKAGHVERALKIAGKFVTSPIETYRAQDIATRLMMGQAVSKAELGTDKNFLNTVNLIAQGMADDAQLRSRLSWSTFNKDKMLPGMKEMMSDPLFSAFMKNNGNDAKFMESFHTQAETVRLGIQEYSQMLDYGMPATGVKVKTPPSLLQLQSEFAAFKNSQVDKHALGTVIGKQSVIFKPDGSIGIMAEAGPEAIMPLARGSNGELGVKMVTNAPRGPSASEGLRIAPEAITLELDHKSAQIFAETLAKEARLKDLLKAGMGVKVASLGGSDSQLSQLNEMLAPMGAQVNGSGQIVPIGSDSSGGNVGTSGGAASATPEQKSMEAKKSQAKQRALAGELQANRAKTQISEAQSILSNPNADPGQKQAAAAKMSRAQRNLANAQATKSQAYDQLRSASAGGATSGAVGSQYRPKYNLSDADLSDDVVNTIAGEARLSDPAGVDAVINTMFNRLHSNGAYGPDGNLQQVARAPGQFAGYRRANAEQAQMIRERIRAIANGDVPDNTNGAQEFRTATYTGPWRWRNGKNGVDIGGNRFAKNPKVSGKYASYASPVNGASTAASAPAASLVKQSQIGADKIRNRPIQSKLEQQLQFAAERAGVEVEVGSGGQTSSRDRRLKGKVGGWTGSTRHDNGGAGDVQLYKRDPVTGKRRLLNQNNPEDRAIMEQFARESVRAGATGIGAADNYMGSSTMHIGGGSKAVWGAKKGSAPYSWIARAHKQGLEQQEAGIAEFNAWLESKQSIANGNAATNVAGNERLPYTSPDREYERRSAQAEPNMPITQPIAGPSTTAANKRASSPPAGGLHSSGGQNVANYSDIPLLIGDNGMLPIVTGIV